MTSKERNTQTMNLTDIIDRIEYSIAGMEGTYYLDDRDDFESNRLKIGLEPSINLIDYVVIVNDDEIEISGIRAHLRYNVTLTFDSIDVVQDTCSYKFDVDFRYASSRRNQRSARIDLTRNSHYRN